jgi:hypothetical protein
MRRNRMPPDTAVDEIDESQSTDDQNDGGEIDITTLDAADLLARGVHGLREGADDELARSRPSLAEALSETPESQALRLQEVERLRQVADDIDANSWDVDMLTPEQVADLQEHAPEVADEVQRRLKVSADELGEAERLATQSDEERAAYAVAKAEAEDHARRVTDVEEFLHIDGVRAISPLTGQVVTVLADDMPENLQAVRDRFHEWQQLPGSERGAYLASLPQVMQDALGVTYGVREPVDISEIPSLQEEAK